MNTSEQAPTLEGRLRERVDDCCGPWVREHPNAINHVCPPCRLHMEAAAALTHGAERADGERLDWLEANRGELYRNRPGWLVAINGVVQHVGDHPTARAAIDAARLATEGE